MQPPAYHRTKDFTEDFGSETDHSSLNAELDSASNSINDIRTNLAILQADDGKLRAGVVTSDSISPELRTALIDGAAAGALGAAVTATAKADEAAEAAMTATNKAGEAATSATNAANSASSINLPSMVGRALNWLRAKVDEAGYEFRTSAELRADVGAAALNGDPAQPFEVQTLTFPDGTQQKTAAYGQPRSLIINGGFDIAQRGSVFAAIPHSTPTIARWVFGQSAGSAVFTVSREADAPTPNSEFSLKALVTTANPAPSAAHEAHIRYAFEGRQCGSQLADKVVTLSFWVKSNHPGKYSIALVKPNSAFTTEETYLDDYTIFASGVWEKKAITIDLATSVDRTWNLANTYALKMRFSYYAGSSFAGVKGWQSGNFIAVAGNNNLAAAVDNYLQIAEVKMEHGAIATPYVAKPIQEELRDVQRYELLIGGGGADSLGMTGYAAAAGETAYQTIAYPTTMRAAPTPAIRGEFQVANTNQPIVKPGTNSLALFIQSLAAGRMAVRNDTTATIFLDAEM